MKNKKKAIIIILIMLIIFLLFYGKIKNFYELENILIFNLFENTKENKYLFDLSSGEKEKSNIYLFSTFKEKGNTKEKIAPGIKGEFEILLKSSEKKNYQIKFNSNNAKPQNLSFNIKNDNKKVKQLEQLNESLKGTLDKNKQKRIIIEWTWEYETNENCDGQDTFDGMNIREYRFNIDILCDN